MDLVLNILQSRGQLTDSEIYDVAVTLGYSKSPDRLRHIRNAAFQEGFVVDRGSRKLSNNRQSTIWTLSRKGRNRASRMTKEVSPQEDVTKVQRTLKRFSEKQLSKLIEKSNKGYRGWDNLKLKEYWLNEMNKAVKSAITKDDFVDVANLAMFCSQHTN